MFRKLATLVLLGALLPAATLAQAPRIRIATLAPRGSLYHQLLLDLGENWRRAEPPGAQFTVFTDGSQGGEADIVRRMRIGQLNGALVSVMGLSEIDTGARALQFMPLMFRSWEEVDAAGAQVRPALDRRFREHGFVVLLWAEAGWVRFFSKEPGLKPDDFKKMKMFAWSGDPDQVVLMKALGYQPVVLETADIIPGLQTGLVNAAPLTPMWALSTQVDAAASHMLDVRWVPIVGGLVLTAKAWDGLSPAGQQALRQAAERAAGELRAQRDAADVQAIKAMEKRGLKVHRLTPELEAQWQELAEAVYPRIRGHMVPADMFDAVQQAVLRHRRTAGASR